MRAARSFLLPVRALGAGMVGVLFCAASPLDDQLEAARSAGDRLSELEVLSRISEARPRDQDILRAVVLGWLKEGDPASAARALERMAEPSEELRALVAARLAAQDSPTKAIPILEEALERIPSSDLLREALADAFLEAGEPGQAVAMLARTAQSREKPSLGLREARARREATDFHGALEAFRSLPREDPAIQRAAPEFERLEAALPELDRTARALARDSSNLEAGIERAVALRSAGLESAAAKEAQSALKKHPGSRAALLLSAHSPPQNFWHPDLELVKIPLPDPSATAERLRRLAALDVAVAGGNASAPIERARILLSLQQPRLALEDARATTADGLLARLEVLAALGQGREAAALAAQAERKDRRLAAQAWTLAAESFLQSWEFERAEAAATRAIERGGRWPRAFELRAMARRRLNDEEGAREDLAAMSKR